MPTRHIDVMATEAAAQNDDTHAALPAAFSAWFASRGWSPRPHQLAVAAAAARGESALLIAPTGGGKTLAGFLPSLIALEAAARAWREKTGGTAGAGGAAARPHALHTLYISPLKALAVDVARNLEAPIREMGLDIRVETRTGDTPPAKRQRQRARPPDILLTTPEQLALFVAQENGAAFFHDLEAVIIDEIHALAPTKRGDLLALGLAALERWAPGYRRIGLSATVAEPLTLATWLAPQPPRRLPIAKAGDCEAEPTSHDSPPTTAAPDGKPEIALAAAAPDGRPPAAVRIIRGAGGAAAQLEVLASEQRIPWAGHTGRHAYEEVYAQIKTARTALVFVNTRSQAEMTFQGLWAANADALPIALHHGSLNVEQRRKVEAAMAAGRLRAVVCTSTLDLGIDWGDVDLVIQMGAPKGAARLIQRIGRANHRLEEPSRALLAPSNRFEVLECLAAQEAVAAGELDGDSPPPGALDVLAQHMMGRACGEPFREDDLYAELTTAAPYADLDARAFHRALDLVSTGGYALATYDRFRRIVKQNGRWRARNREAAQRHRMNVGAIVEEPMLDVRVAAGRRAADAAPQPTPVRPQQVLRRRETTTPAPRVRQIRGGRAIGRIEEWYASQLSPGDTFLFSGRTLRFEGIADTDVYATPAQSGEPRVPSWQGGKFPLSTFLASRVRAMISDPARWRALPAQVREWLEAQAARSVIPGPKDMLVETFPRGGKMYLVAYPFDGRLAHQTLGMLLTRRLERLGKHPMGFVCNDYALSVWGLEDMADTDLGDLFSEDMLGDDLDAWINESHLMKRTFRHCALISGLLERRMPGHEKTGRQVTFSTDLIYDVLRSHQPDHILLEVAWRDAGSGLLDLRRLADGLKRIRGRIRHAALTRVSPLAVPVMLEIGREPVFGAAQDALLAETAEDLAAEALG